MFWDKYVNMWTANSLVPFVNIIAADDLAPCVTKSSSVMIFTVWDDLVLVFQDRISTTYATLVRKRDDIKYKLLLF